jgi:hypothetical protein
MAVTEQQIIEIKNEVILRITKLAIQQDARLVDFKII